MNIVIVNGSHRKDGATAFILNAICQQLKKYKDIDIYMVHAADMKLNYCVGCGVCYQQGACIFKDDIEQLSSKIRNAYGIILGSPTYACNVSAQMKTIIDRGHFIMEQSLYGKYAISVTTYENYGGRDCAKILNRLLTYSGATLCGTIAFRKKASSNLLENPRLTKKIQKNAGRIYCDITKKHRHIFQSIKHFIILRMGIRPFILSNRTRYGGVINRWEAEQIRNIYKGRELYK